MKIKTIRITYWITTSLIALLMTYSAYAYLTNETMVTAFKHLGYPDYFRTELAIAKLIGAVLLIAPVTTHFKEWAYAGFKIWFIITSDRNLNGFDLYGISKNRSNRIHSDNV